MEIELNKKEKGFLSYIKRFVTSQNKIFTIALAMFLVLTMGTAMWIMKPNITGYSIYKVKSNQPNFTIVGDLFNETVDTQESNYTGTQIFKIDSSDKEKVLVNYETIKTDDTNDLCLDYHILLYLNRYKTIFFKSGER